jgi:hypothetical protein
MWSGNYFILQRRRGLGYGGDGAKIRVGKGIGAQIKCMNVWDFIKE